MKLVLARPGSPEAGLDHEALWPPVLLGGLVLLRLPEGMLEGYLAPCLWRLVTGFACPGCGTTRALRALGDLDPLAALAWNPLAALAGIGAGLFVAYAAVAVLGRTRRIRLVGLDRADGIALVAGVLANWAYLLAAGR